MFRLIDCEHFTQKSSLLVYETLTIPDVPYVSVTALYSGTAIACDAGSAVRPHFAMYDANRGSKDPISLDIVLQLCIRAQNANGKFLWVDELCNYGESFIEPDVTAHHRYRAFQASTLCELFPHGLHYPTPTQMHNDSLWISGVQILLEALSAPMVNVLDRLGFQTSIMQWVSEIDTGFSERDTGLLLDVIYFCKGSLTDDVTHYYRGLSTWRCVLYQKDLSTDYLLPLAICFLSNPADLLQLAHEVTRFKQGFSDSSCQDTIVVAFRDAWSLVGLDISPQWVSLLQSQELPTILGPRRGLGGMSFVRTLVVPAAVNNLN